MRTQERSQRGNAPSITEQDGAWWEPGVTYVIGHRHPDTDAIAAALGYAWYLNERGEANVRAARSGEFADQTRFALERFGQEAPPLLLDVGPTFGHVARPEAAVKPRAPLSEAIAHLSEQERIVPVVNARTHPVGVVTPLAVARAASAGPEAFAQPCRGLAEAIPAFSAREKIRDHRDALLRGEANDFLVTDDRGRYLGIATQESVLDPPRARLILVDHNELAQAVTGAEEAEVVGVLDHHRLGDLQTAAPIPFVVEPVGSTCTLVAEQCRERGLTPPAGLAGMMLSGILSDTLVLRSPTTTERDRAAAGWLAELAGVDSRAHGEDLLRAGSRVAAHPAGEIVDADRKSYQIGGKTISIGQVEVTKRGELSRRQEALLAALEERREREALDLVCLMVTDVCAGRSRLLCRGDPRILTALPFEPAREHEFELGEMVSRKQQLVPVLYAMLEAERG
jgi:manganese-dependent inorganic pyrophosphatase